ncbi:MAG: carboxy-S-adenosyl-L-methionine synthase CmoA [Gammaproteobacteria bacterium]|nr:carboxy-S-adenosyl-L-methionine synthase CmoA [Gammaproteobacteria bacterium]
MKKDNLFLKKSTAVDFDFGEKTAEVFDDMLDRSVPLYRELQRMAGELANEFAVGGTQVYDLGCSTGTTLHTLCESIDKDVTFIGIDNSEAMLAKAEENFKAAGVSEKYQFILDDLNERLDIQNASVVILNLTLQFVRPLYRELLIRNIYSGLNKNGCLILVEKVLGNDSLFNRQFIKFYYDLKKRNGYSEMEIAQKREALENVLIPYRVDENIELLNKQGFSHVDIFFKWYNFCGFLAVK